MFRPPLLWVLLIVAGVLLRKSLSGWLRDSFGVLRSIRIESVGQGAALLYCAIMLALALVIALAPPTHWDSLTYHLVAAQRYFQKGAITAQPDNFYLGLSQNVEMLYGLTIGLFGRDDRGRSGAFRPGADRAAGDCRSDPPLRRALGGLRGGAAAAERL